MEIPDGMTGLRSGHRRAVLVFLLLGASSPSFAQSAAGVPVGTSGAPSVSRVSREEDERPVSWKLLAPNILHDQKPIWTFPAKLVKDDYWKPTLVVVAATAGSVALDPHDTPYFRRTSTFTQFCKTFSGTNMAVGTAVVPLSIYAVALARKDVYGQHTAMLAGESAVDAEILATVMQHIDRRLRPSEIPPNGDFSDSWFRQHGTVVSAGGSFPSGHAIAAFSVATVLANRYHEHRWVPWVAYGLAGLVGFSRIPLQAHFPSDVFAGAALGYVISHYVVLHNP